MGELLRERELDRFDREGDGASISCLGRREAPEQKSPEVFPGLFKSAGDCC